MIPLRRLYWYVTGDMAKAEGLSAPAVTDIPWLDDNPNDKLAEYALGAALRSVEKAEAALHRIQDKATASLTTAVALLPLTFAGIGLLAAHIPGPLAYVGTTAFLLSSLMLAAAAIMATLAGGLSLAGGLNVARLAGGPMPLDSLRAAEARTWHYASSAAMHAGTIKGADLFACRRLLLVGAIVASVGAGSLVGQLSIASATAPEAESLAPLPTETPSPSAS